MERTCSASMQPVGTLAQDPRHSALTTITCQDLQGDACTHPCWAKLVDKAKSVPFHSPQSPRPWRPGTHGHLGVLGRESKEPSCSCTYINTFAGQVPYRHSGSCRSP